MGTIIFCYVVVIANVEVAYQTHSHSVISIFLQVFSISTFFIMYSIQNQMAVIPTLYHTFTYMFRNPLVYFGMILIVVGQIILHVLYHLVKGSIVHLHASYLEKAAELNRSTPLRKVQSLTT